MTHLLQQKLLLILKCRCLETGWMEWMDYSALLQADIASTGTATHVTRTRHAQVTAAILYILLKAAYDKYTSESDSEIQLEQWCLEQANLNVQLLAEIIVFGDFVTTVNPLRKLSALH